MKKGNVKTGTKAAKKAVVVENLTSAPTFKRLLAFLVDLFLVNILISPFRNVIVSAIPQFSDPSKTFELFNVFSGLSKHQLSLISYTMFFAALIAFLYFSVLEYRYGATIGKLLLRLKVEPLAEKRYWRYAVRSLFLFPLFPLSLLWVVDPVYMLTNPKRQRFSEYVSRTIVVDEVGGDLVAGKRQ